MRIAGVILAGGQSTRMGGGDKCLRLLDERPLLAHVIERLAPQVEAVALNANGDAARFEPWASEVIADRMPELGPLGGIHAGLAWAGSHPAGFTHIMTVAADTPFFPARLAARFMETAGMDDHVVLAASGGTVHPTFGLWPVTLLPRLEAFLKEGGAASVRRFAEGEGQAVIADFPADGEPDPFFNVNTPEDLAAARNLLRRVRP